MAAFSDSFERRATMRNRATESSTGYGADAYPTPSISLVILQSTRI